ncbi:MAG: FAD-dependent monooxygenase [Chloroflexota bacterium]
MNTLSTTTDVLIVGAGPTGLALANVLAQYDVSFFVIDRESGPTNQSRAAIVHIRTLELWDKLGVADPAIADGVKVHGVNLLINGKQVTHFPLAAREGVPSPFPFVLAYPQGQTEQLLLKNLNTDRYPVVWQTELIGFTPANNGVRTVIRRSDGVLQEIDTRYVIGADGANSLVRRLSNVDFPGTTYAPTAFLADVVLDPPPDASTIQLNLANGGFVGILALGEGRYRLFGALSPKYAAAFQSQNEGRTVSIEDLQRWFEEYFYMSNRITRADWTSIYRIHHRLADHFRSERIFLLGDAAHIHAPAGGQGMNLAIGDAFNLGWKLALVLRNEVHEEVLDSYEIERRPVAQTILRGADRGFELEATQNSIIELFRLYVLPSIINGVARFRAVRGVIFQLFSQTWINYRSSPVVKTTQRVRQQKGICAGDRAPHGMFQDGLNRGLSIFALLCGPDHHLLVFEGLQSAVPHTELVNVLQTLLDTYRIKIQIHTITQSNCELHMRYHMTSPGIVLVRPDGHIAYIGGADDLVSLGQFLDQWYVRKSAIVVHDDSGITTASHT